MVAFFEVVNLLDRCTQTRRQRFGGLHSPQHRGRHNVVDPFLLEIVGDPLGLLAAQFRKRRIGTVPMINHLTLGPGVSYDVKIHG